MQDEVLSFHQLFRSPCSLEKPKLRVLALAAAMDMGGNTPIEFLLEHSGIELQTLYVVDGIELPMPLPEHDVAIVIASDSEECRQALRKIESAASRWPRPLLNPPHLVGNLDRDKLHRLLHGIEGLDIPSTEAASRAQLSGVADTSVSLADIADGLAFPIIIRPRGSHAGTGLAKIDDRSALGRYLAERPEVEFFVSRFVDYAKADGLFRKCESSSSTAGPMPVTWRSPIAGISGISTPAWPSATRSAPRKPISCAGSTRFLPSATGMRWPRWRSGSGWIISPSIAPSTRTASC